MPPELTGQFTVEDLADGTRAFRLRFRALGQRHREVLHERPGCGCGCGGGWNERAARAELGNVLARVRAGVWEPRERPAAPEPVTDSAMPTFHEYASAWLAGKRQGVLGDKPIDANTEADYRWRLSRHLLPYFAAHPPRCRSTAELCLAFKSHKLQEASEIRDGARRGRRPAGPPRASPAAAVGPSSIRKLIDTLAAILDDAIEDELIDRNPARGKRMRVRGPEAGADLPRDGRARRGHRSRRRPGQLADASPSRSTARASRRNVARLAAAGRRPSASRPSSALAKSTVTLPPPGARRVAARSPTPAAARSSRRSGAAASASASYATCASASSASTTATAARFRIPDAKTEAGIREVQMSPDLVDRLIEHLDATPRGRPADRPRRLRCSPTSAAAGSPASASARSCARRPLAASARQQSAACRRSRRRRRTRCGAPTSRSRCSPTASTSSGS